MAQVEMRFEMPGDQEWDSAFWERIGVGPEWDRLALDLKKAGIQVEDDEDIVLTFKKGSAPRVRKLIDAARAGEYGSDVQTYWRAAKFVQ